MRVAGIDRILREFRQGVEEIYGPRLLRVVLFGSQARDDAEDGSDIDVMLVLEGEVNPLEEIEKMSSFTGALSLKYDVLVSCVYMPEERFQREQSPLMLNVRREGVLV